MASHGKADLQHTRIKRQKDQKMNYSVTDKFRNLEVMESSGILQAQKITNHVTIWAIFGRLRMF